MQDQISTVLTSRDVLQYSAEMLTTLSQIIRPLHSPVLDSLLNLAAIEARRAASLKEIAPPQDQTKLGSRTNR
jgi:hypothetical protein